MDQQGVYARKPTIDEQIDWIHCRRKEIQSWLEMIVIGGEPEDSHPYDHAKHISDSENELAVITAIEENLIAMRMQMKVADSIHNPASNYNHQPIY